MISGSLKTLFDLGVLAGLAVFVFGLYLVWHPLAPLVGGLLVAGVFFFAGYDLNRRAQIERVRTRGVR